MKKIVIILAVLILIGGAVGVFFLTKKNGSTSGNEESKATFTILEACKLLTKEKAVTLLGTSTTLGQEPSPSNSDDLKVTNCVYNNNTGNFKDIVSVSILVRAPLTQEGADSNTETFNDASLVGNTTVEGYGETAAWNSSTGQLNILKDKNWIIVSFGKTQPTSRTLDDTKKAADLTLK